MKIARQIMAWVTVFIVGMMCFIAPQLILLVVELLCKFNVNVYAPLSYVMLVVGFICFLWFLTWDEQIIKRIGGGN